MPKPLGQRGPLLILIGVIGDFFLKNYDHILMYRYSSETNHHDFGNEIEVGDAHGARPEQRLQILGQLGSTRVT